IAGDDNAAFAIGAEVFAGIEAEAAGDANAAGALSIIFGAMGLAGILDDGEPVASGDDQDVVHRGHLPVKVNRQDGLGARGDGTLDLVGVDVESFGVDVDEDRAGADIANGGGRGDEGEGGGDDL